MQEIRMSNVTNWPTRFAEMVDLIGLSEEDRQLVKASAPLIMAHAGPITDCVYTSFLKYPQARKFFVTDDDEPDAERIEANKQTMLSWIRATAAAPLNEGFIRYLAAISQMHVNIPIHRPRLGPVPPRYVIGTIAYYQTAIAELLQKEMPDTALASRTSTAWNKWLMIGLELLLAHYLLYEDEG
jgi:hemoglobin-like flavoprotein